MAHWVRILASWYPYGGGGSCGNLNDGRLHFAELGTATLTGVATGYGRIAEALGMNGELPCGFGLYIRYNGRATFATKADRGYGDPSKSLHDQSQRRIDLYENLAHYLNFDGLGYVEVTTKSGLPPSVTPKILEPDANIADWDPSPIIRNATYQLGVHGKRAFDSANSLSRLTGAVDYCTIDGAKK